MRHKFLVPFALAAALAAGPVYAGGSPVGTRGQGSKTQSSATGPTQQDMAAAKKQKADVTIGRYAALGAYYAAYAGLQAATGTYYNTISNLPKKASAYFENAKANYQQAAIDYGHAAQSSATAAKQQGMAAAKKQKEAGLTANYAALGAYYASNAAFDASQGTYYDKVEYDPNHASGFFAGAVNLYQRAATEYDTAASAAAEGF